MGVGVARAARRPCSSPCTVTLAVFSLRDLAFTVHLYRTASKWVMWVQVALSSLGDPLGSCKDLAGVS